MTIAERHNARITLDNIFMLAWLERRALSKRIAKLSPNRSAVFIALQACGARNDGEAAPRTGIFDRPCQRTADYLSRILVANEPARLFVGPSTVGGGLGVFTSVELSIGSVCAFYPGTIYGSSADEASDGGGSSALPSMIPLDSSYVLARPDGHVIDAGALASPLALIRLHEEKTPWAVAHMTQHGENPSAIFMPVDFDFNDSVAQRLPYEFVDAPPESRICPPGGAGLPLWASRSVPGAAMIATRAMPANSEIFVDYSFDPLSDVPLWMKRVKPSTEWDAYDAACARAHLRAEVRPTDVDEKWELEMKIGEDMRA
jgi:hypothetical protein